MIFDLLLLFGFETLMVRDSLHEEAGDHLDEKETDKEAPEEEVENGADKDHAVKKSARWVLSFLTSLLDSEVWLCISDLPFKVCSYLESWLHRFLRTNCSRRLCCSQVCFNQLYYGLKAVVILLSREIG